MKATEVTAGLAESKGSLLLGLWRDSLHVTCGLTACTPGSAPGPTLGNEYGKTLPFYLYRRRRSVQNRLEAETTLTVCVCVCVRACVRVCVCVCGTDGLGVREEVARHDEVLSSVVEPHCELLAPAVDRLQALAHAVGVRPLAVHQLVGGPDQTQHRLLDILRRSQHTADARRQRTSLSVSRISSIHTHDSARVKFGGGISPDLRSGTSYSRSTTSNKAVTRGVFWVFEHPRNFRKKLDTQIQIYY